MIRDFFKEHKQVLIGLFLYIVVYFISNIFSPWQTSIDLSMIDSSLSETIASEVPMKIMFFGIYELLEFMVYSDAENTIYGLVFFISLCAFFTYTYFISVKFIKEDDFNNKVELIAVEYLFDNIFSYVSCIAVYYLFNPIYYKVTGFVSEHSTIIRILVVFLFVMLIIVPAIPQGVKMLIYIISSVFIIKLVDKIVNHFNDNVIVAVLFSFIVTAIALILLNLLLEYIMKKFYSVALWSWLASWVAITEGLIGLVITIIGGILVIGFWILIIGIIVNIIVYLNGGL